MYSRITTLFDDRAPHGNISETEISESDPLWFELEKILGTLLLEEERAYQGTVEKPQAIIP